MSVWLTLTLLTNTIMRIECLNTQNNSDSDQICSTGSTGKEGVLARDVPAGIMVATHDHPLSVWRHRAPMTNNNSYRKM
jgi:hypothetical protein